MILLCRVERAALDGLTEARRVEIGRLRAACEDLGLPGTEVGIWTDQVVGRHIAPPE